MDDAAILQLPNDPVLLKRIIASHQTQIEERDSALTLCDIHLERIKQESAAVAKPTQTQWEREPMSMPAA